MRLMRFGPGHSPDGDGLLESRAKCVRRSKGERCVCNPGDPGPKPPLLRPRAQNIQDGILECQLKKNG
ncbi:Protein of unknown function [Pyronema omphalodes CBS 100304]|uniref:Uncharacterized protein n=1 Tax=Pyronema omphalodes (strain CBS 100304) TaxID=1076935 RepID=U4L230_PYROM|nr:Protein of unknown function [Pyronema omphalodes CBS 100304]